MTCVVGIAQDGKVTIGADSASASSWDVRATALPKVFCVGPMLIGYTTSFRMGQLLRHNLKPPTQGTEDDLEYMVCGFIEAVRQCLKNGGYTKIDNNREESGAFLVGYKGVLYHVGGDFQVNSYQDGMAAVGCGADYALAVVHVLTDLPARQRIERALDTAAYFSGGVMPPFVVLAA